MGYYQRLNWWDVLASPICLLWFLGLCYVFCIVVIRPFLIQKGTAKAPFLLWGEQQPNDHSLVVPSSED
ncbi:hypothetical protein Q1695_010200 [Nippostrongylus brasiliensis]|nr:hypothetical protein Q1695_010200 [Nippostrongylus brasiliensis]